MKKFLSLILLLSLLIGCAPKKNDAGLQVYRVISPEYQTMGQVLRTERVYPKSGQSDVDALIAALDTGCSDERAYNPLQDIAILDYELRDKLLILELDSGYGKLQGLSKTLADACCTLTLCALPEIDRVSIASEGIVLTVGLNPQDMLLESDESRSTHKDVSLFYMDEGGSRLIADRRSLSADSTGTAERYIVKELLRPRQGFVSPLPQGTELLGVTRKGQLCTLNLSREFLENLPDTATGEIAAVYSLVNSLATLGGISSVALTVEGESITDYLNLSLNNPIAPLPFLPGDLGSGESSGGKLYFAMGGELFGVPCIVSSLGAQQAVLDHLMEYGGFGPYESLFTENDELRHLSTSQGVARISISRSFFERRSPEQAALALDALTLSLIELNEVSSVIVSYPDGTVPKLPQRDLAKPILPKAEILK